MASHTGTLLASVKRYKIPIWWPLPLHTFLVIGFSIILLILIDGKSFLTSEIPHDIADTQGNQLPRFYQSDITTLVSAVLVIIRLVAGAWVGVLGWRMCFCILERSGASLEQTSRTVQYRFPPLTRKLFQHSTDGGPTFAILLWLTCICVIPSQFSSPVLTGAITWIPETALLNSTNTINITTPGPGRRWDELNEFQNNRYHAVLSAVGMASQASGDNFNASLGPTYRRRIPSMNGLQPNSTLENITMPYFAINSLEWVFSDEQVGDDLDMLNDVAWNASNPLLSFSKLSRDSGDIVNPFVFGTDPGRIALVNEVQYQSESTYPVPELRTESRWIIMATQAATNSPGSCSPSDVPFDSMFGSVPGLNNSTDICVVFARLNFTAGVSKCNACRVVSDSLVEAQSELTEPYSDPLVDLSLAMIPEVLFFMRIINATSYPTWNNLDGFTRGMLSIAYQASWNALASDFAVEPLSQVLYKTPLPVLNASVTKWRVAVWCAANLLVVLSGFTLALIQSTCRLESSTDPAITALLLDATSITDYKNNEGYDSDVTESEMHGLRLRLLPASDRSTCKHNRLELDVKREIFDDGSKRGAYVSVQHIPSGSSTTLER